MNGLRGWFARVVMVLAVLGALSVAAAGGCGYPPDNSGAWHFVDDVAINMRIMSQGPIAKGHYQTVDRLPNYESVTLRNKTMTWSGTSSIKYSTSLKTFGGFTDQRTSETLRVTVDVPPMQEARLRVRNDSQYDYYSFDAGCLWFNASTKRYLQQVVEYGVQGEAHKSWHVASVSFRSVY